MTASQYNKARNKAINRFLRLMSHAKAHPKLDSFFKSKKFLAALARNNALPKTNIIQFKGSTAIPLPWKKNQDTGPIIDFDKFISGPLAI